MNTHCIEETLVCPYLQILNAEILRQSDANQNEAVHHNFLVWDYVMYYTCITLTAKSYKMFLLTYYRRVSYGLNWRGEMKGTCL